MSDYRTELPVPHVVLGFNGLINVVASVGETEVGWCGGVGKCIKIPTTLPGEPRVTLQAMTSNGKPNGPCLCFDYEADQGRGVWVTFDEKIHKVPACAVVEDEDCEVTAALSDPEPDGHTQGRSLDMSASSDVDYSQSADAPKDDCDDDTCDGEDIDIENSSPRGW